MLATSSSGLPETVERVRHVVWQVHCAERLPLHVARVEHDEVRPVPRRVVFVVNEVPAAALRPTQAQTEGTQRGEGSCNIRDKQGATGASREPPEQQLRSTKTAAAAG